ncbi:MAG: sporulation protein YunB [Christensenellaceae bacterium]|nr:sporulation protein YunB [Christensenellaceae bacterium]
MRAFHRKFRLKKALVFIAALIALTVYGLTRLETNLTEVVLSLAQAQARALAVQALNQTADEIVLSGVTYDQLMAITMDGSGQIRLIQANTPEMNLLANRASTAAQQKISSLEQQSLYVPLGSALGMTLFAGAGPLIEVRILPVGAVNAGFTTEFETAGINQTRHKISLTLTAQVELVIPTGAMEVQAVTQVAVAESIIVGQVPDSYVNVENTDGMLNLAP